MLAVHPAARARPRCTWACSWCRDTGVLPAKEKSGMSSQRLFIRNGFVVSMDPEVGEIPNGDVLVEDGVIVEVGRGLEVGDAEEIDATGMIVMPGFVDTHRHTWQTPVRGVLPSCTLDHYFAVMLGSVGGHYRPDDVHIGDYAGSLEALNARHHDTARLVAHQQHSRPLGRGDPGAQGRRHPSRLRARHADRRRVVVVQRARAPRGHPPHPRDVLLVRRRPDHARDGGAPARQLELRRREARLGARTRARDPDQRPRRHAAPQPALHPRQGHARPRADGRRTSATST